jgi:hypothetical protein
MADWDRFTIDEPTTGGLKAKADELKEIHHIVHPQAASYILDEGRIRTGLVYDESKLTKSRTTVIWLSANLWDPGSIYGTVRFAFPWLDLIQGCRFYWVEGMDYRPPAYRILVTKNDYSHLGLTSYDPKVDKGPLRFLNGLWYRNSKDTAEFMLDRDLDLSEATRFQPEKHKENGCRIYKSGCRHLKTPTMDTAMWMVSHVLSRGIHTIDHVYKSYFPRSPDLDHGMSGIWLRLGGFNHSHFSGSIGPGPQSHSIIKGALGLLAADRRVEAKELTSLLDSPATLEKGLEGIVNDHFNVSGWKIGD